ncbi:MAG: hypothetical protein ACXIT4_04875 [Erythrobacter sp.]
MTAAAPIPSSPPPAAPAATPAAPPPQGWEALRAAGDIQFEPVEIPPIPPREPGWFERLLVALFEWLGQVLGPVGQWLGASWGVIQWGLIAVVAGFVIYTLARLFGPLARRPKPAATQAPDEWRPDTAASLALLEDADDLAAQGRYDEAARLLLARSVSAIAAARPDWVEPSSTARELAALPALPQAARTAFGVMAAMVERSLFGLKPLGASEWQEARQAFGEFALAAPARGVPA